MLLTNEVDQKPIEFEHHRSLFKVTRGHERSKVQMAVKVAILELDTSFLACCLLMGSARGHFSRSPEVTEGQMVKWLSKSQFES